MVMANEVDQSWQQECMWTCWRRAYTLYASQEDREQGDIFGNWISKDVRITQTICVVTFCWKHGIYKQEKVIWPCMSAFFFLFVYLNPTFLSFCSITWPLSCSRRKSDALLNSFTLLRLKPPFSYLFHMFKDFTIKQFFLSFLSLVYVSINF